MSEKEEYDALDLVNIARLVLQRFRERYEKRKYVKLDCFMEKPKTFESVLSVFTAKTRFEALRIFGWLSNTRKHFFRKELKRIVKAFQVVNR
jgi:hypothetical protein